METKKILKDNLISRIDRIEELLRSAGSCIEEGDLFQAAVRLQMVESNIQFDETAMLVLEAESLNASEA